MTWQCIGSKTVCIQCLLRRNLVRKHISIFSLESQSLFLHENPTYEHKNYFANYKFSGFGISITVSLNWSFERGDTESNGVYFKMWLSGWEKKKNSTKCKSVTGSFNVKSFEGRKKYVKLLFINDLIICSCSKVISLWSSSQVVFIYLENLWLLMTYTSSNYHE